MMKYTDLNDDILILENHRLRNIVKLKKKQKTIY
jgi:hypothetical protein